MSATTLAEGRVDTRALLRNVYLWMFGGLVLTAASSLFTANALMKGMLSLQSFKVLSLFLIIGEFVIVFMLVARIMKMSVRAAMTSFVVFALINGAMLSTIFLRYSRTAISSAFLTSALMFGVMSIWASTTKKDISGWGRYLTMGIIGLLVAMLVNFIFRLFIPSLYGPLNMMISLLGVVLFTALTAYDTQKITRLSEQVAEQGADEASYVKLSILGALTLYLDFINLFLFMLRIFGGSRR